MSHGLTGWGVVGVPTSVAAHWPGLERGPTALRAAGLLEGLRAGGGDLLDHGDRAVARWRATAERPNDATRAAEVLRDAASAIGEVIAAGRRPLVLGGDCTLAIALVSAMVAAGRDVGLVYVDGGQDLQLPADHPEEPILDSMGVAHLLDLPGTSDAVAGIGPRRPLLTPDHVVFFGFGHDEEDEHGLAPSLRLTATDVGADPAGTAARAARAAAGGRDGFVVHLDVDVLDHLALPVADIPQYGRGLTLDVLLAALGALVTHRGFAGMTLVELNPDHADDDSIHTLVTGLVGTLRTAG